jgi:hypothetical protein
MPLSDRDRRAIKVGGILAAVVLLALLGLGQLGKGGEEALPPLAPSVTAGPTGSPTAEPTTSGSPSVQPSAPAPTAVFGGRDPFSPPPIFAVLTPTTSPTSPGTSPTSPGTSPTSPAPTSPGTTPPSPTPTAPSNGSSTSVGGHTVVLLDTFPSDGEQLAQIEVDGTVYNVGEGDSFAGGDFEVLTISANCASVLFGDDAFTLCVTPEK